MGKEMKQIYLEECAWIIFNAREVKKKKMVKSDNMIPLLAKTERDIKRQI